MVKKCFWRHGDFKTIKIIEHQVDATANKGKPDISAYKAKRITTIEKCGYCGKLIMDNNYN